MRLMPRIGQIFSLSSTTFLFFTILIFITCLVHAFNSPDVPMIKSLVSEYVSNGTAQYVPLILAFVEAQLYIPAAAFQGGMDFIALPPTFLYYMWAMFAGLFAGLITLRRDSRIIDSILAPLLTAFKVLIGLVILNVLMNMALSGISGSLQNLPSYLPPVASAIQPVPISAATYVIAFFITYACFLVGTFSAALLREFVFSPAKPSAEK